MKEHIYETRMEDLNNQHISIAALALIKQTHSNLVIAI